MRTLEDIIADYYAGHVAVMISFLHRSKGLCESPIEELLLTGMLLLNDDPTLESVQYYFKWPADVGIDEFKAPFDGIFGWQQVPIDKFRVDFLYSVAVTDRGGVRRNNFVAVECDGHEFHERTKHQAARDRSRDRDLTARRVTVMRFTGSEIYKDPIGCAEQLSFFLDHLYREQQTARDDG